MSMPLTHFEMEMLLRVSSMKWTPEIRQYIAKLVPTLYAKYTNTAVAVSAKGESVSMSIEAIEPAATKSPMFNPNKGAPWE